MLPPSLCVSPPHPPFRSNPFTLRIVLTCVPDPNSLGPSVNPICEPHSYPLAPVSADEDWHAYMPGLTTLTAAVLVGCCAGGVGVSRGLLGVRL